MMVYEKDIRGHIYTFSAEPTANISWYTMVSDAEGVSTRRWRGKSF